MSPNDAISERFIGLRRDVDNLADTVYGVGDQRGLKGKMDKMETVIEQMVAAAEKKEKEEMARKQWRGAISAGVIITVAGAIALQFLSLMRMAAAESVMTDAVKKIQTINAVSSSDSPKPPSAIQ